jgi:hypothetical protein
MKWWSKNKNMFFFILCHPHDILHVIPSNDGFGIHTIGDTVV